MPIPEISPIELAKRLRGPAAEKPILVDVRSHGEHQLVAFPGSMLMPLHELQDHAEELQALVGKDVVVYCHHGIRSLSGAAYLREHGVDARSLEGGIDLYAVTVDPSLPRY